jgi:hypothetical protein
MQFGREPLPARPTMTTVDGERGWVCSEKAEHFQLASERSTSDPTASIAAQGSQDDHRPLEEARGLDHSILSI